MDPEKLKGFALIYATLIMVFTPLGYLSVIDG
jgi:hypothetical protein